MDKPLTYSGFLALNRERQRWSEEIRFDSVDKVAAYNLIDRWTIGIFFEDFKEDTVYNGYDAGETKYETQTLSFYGKGTHIFSEKTRLTLGLRTEYYYLKTDVAYSKKPASENDPSFNDWLFGGKLTLEHDLSTTE